MDSLVVRVSAVRFIRKRAPDPHKQAARRVMVPISRVQDSRVVLVFTMFTPSMGESWSVASLSLSLSSLPFPSPSHLPELATHQSPAVW